MGKQLLKPNQIACFALAKHPNIINSREIEYENGPAFSMDVKEIPYRLKPKAGYGNFKYWIANETGDIKGTLQEKKIIAHALRAWEYYIPYGFDRVKNEEEADIKIYFRTDDPYWADRPSVLAYAGYPELSLQGIVVINDTHRWSMLGESVPGWKLRPDLYTEDDKIKFKTYVLEQTLRHEFGHTLGLPHDKIHPDAVLGPYYSKKRIRLDVSDGSDVDRIQAKYGKKSWFSRFRMLRWRKYIDAKLKKYND